MSTAKAAKWLGVPERTVREWCATGRLEGAFQPAGHYGKWLIPLRAIEAMLPYPADASLLADIADIADSADVVFLDGQQ